jgi:hypothetical protein
VQKPQGDKAAHQGLEFAEAMVNAFAESAKLYCRWWGPLGGPMSRGIDAWAQMQCGYLHWLGKTSGPRGGSSYTSQYREGTSTAESGAREAQRIARESAREAQRIAGEAERNAREAERSASEDQRSPEKDFRNTIRESVSRSEAVGQEEGPRAGTAAVTDAEGLPLEGYDSLNVHQVTQELGKLSIEEIERLRDYEGENRGRRSLMDRFERRIRAVREDLKGNGETEEGPEEGIRSIIRESVRRSEREE